MGVGDRDAATIRVKLYVARERGESKLAPVCTAGKRALHLSNIDPSPHRFDLHVVPSGYANRELVAGAVVPSLRCVAHDDARARGRGEHLDARAPPIPPPKLGVGEHGIAIPSRDLHVGTRRQFEHQSSATTRRNQSFDHLAGVDEAYHAGEPRSDSRRGQVAGGCRRL